MGIKKRAKTADSNQPMKKDAVSRTTYVVVYKCLKVNAHQCPQEIFNHSYARTFMHNFLFYMV